MVQANLLAATTAKAEALGRVFNVACGERTTLDELFQLIREPRGARSSPASRSRSPVYRDFRPGDVRHSLADVGKARALLGYEPTHAVAEGLDCTAPWYVEDALTARRAGS